MTRCARAFGVALGVDEDDDLPFTAAYSPSAYVLEKIAAHETEIVKVLKPRRGCIAAVWPLLQDLDEEQFIAFRNAKGEEIEILQAVLDAMDAAARIVIPEVRSNGGTWGEAVKADVRAPQCEIREPAP
jgi:hypothetical protein